MWLNEEFSSTSSVLLGQSQVLLDHIDKLTRTIKHEYLSGTISLRSYESQINYLTVIRLYFEDLSRQLKLMLNQFYRGVDDVG